MPQTFKKFRALVIILFSFLLLFLLIHLGHARWFPVDVILYSALYDGALALAVTALLLYAWRRRSILSGTEKTLVICLCASLGYIFAITVPTVIDRSLSIYILEKLAQRGGGIRQGAFKRIFQEEYLLEHRLVEARLTEQVTSGTIKIVNGCVVLTDWGRLITRFTAFYRHNLLPKKRQLMGEYTDALTNPFRNSRSDVNYRCSN